MCKSVRYLSAITMFFGLVNGLGAIAMQSQEASNAPLHASIRAYPDAVVSATDATTGITVSIDSDGTSVVAHDATGAELWRRDVLQETGRPYEGFPVVRHVANIEGGKFSVVVGKHRYVEGDIRTGKLKLIGEN